jgi:hypothetical protein
VWFWSDAALSCVFTGYVASVGKDRVIRGWAPGVSEGGKRAKGEGPGLRCVAHLTGHDASVESVAARANDGMVRRTWPCQSVSLLGSLGGGPSGVVWHVR